MADNVTIPATGTGDATPKVATEQIASTGEHKQIVELGVPGTSRSLIPADAMNGLLIYSNAELRMQQLLELQQQQVALLQLVVLQLSALSGINIPAADFMNESITLQ